MSSPSGVGAATYGSTARVDGMWTVVTTGDFEGRLTPPHQGIDEIVQQKHNVYYDLGKNLSRNLMSGLVGGTANASFISLCNSTEGSGAGGTAECGVPVAGATESWNAFPASGACGMENASGTVSIIQDNNGNVSIYHTFTASGCDTKINATRLVNITGWLFAGTEHTEVSLQASTSDTYKANYTESHV